VRRGAMSAPVARIIRADHMLLAIAIGHSRSPAAAFAPSNHGT
jgi:hypothetical protein